MRTPLTDKALGIPHTGDRFRDIRKKAKLDEEDRHKKFKRDKKIKVPKYRIGQEVVLTGGFRSRHYHLAEIVDFEETVGSFSYYGILKKTTEPEKFERIGRLIRFEEKDWWSSSYQPANVENKGIKWLLTP